MVHGYIIDISYMWWYIDGLNTHYNIALSLHVYGGIIFRFKALVLDNFLLTAIR